MAQFAMSGVQLDGSTGTLAPTAQNFSFPAGEDVVFTLTVTGVSGSPINLTGYSGAMVIKVAQSASSVLALATLALTLTSPATGVGTFTLPGSLTKSFSTGLLWYDVFITSGSGLRDEVVPTSLLTLNFAVGA